MIEKIKLISVEPKDGNYAQVENPDVQYIFPSDIDIVYKINEIIEVVNLQYTVLQTQQKIIDALEVELLEVKGKDNNGKSPVK